MSFLDIQFPTDISYGATGGPEYSTDVVIEASGDEQRNKNWSQARAPYEVSHAIKTAAQMSALIAFFRICFGKALGFRFKDWMDYVCLATDGRLEAGGVGTGVPTYQLYKTYSNAAGAFYRKITRYVLGTLVVYRNGTPVTVGVAAGNISTDINTGKITFVADSTKNVNANSTKAITGITQANPGSVTCVGHGFVTGDKIKIVSVGGMTQVNNLYFTITVVDADHFTIGVNTTAYTAYTSGGSAIKYGITQTNPVRVYSTAHGLANGSLVYESGATGMTQVNGLSYTVANASANYFDLSGIDGTAFSAYSGSGLLSVFPQPTDVLTASFEFDVPCRFDTDRLEGELTDDGSYSWNSIPILELRE